MIAFTGPSYSGLQVGLLARNQVARQVIYRVRAGKQQQYDYVVPGNPKTELQQWWRSVLKNAVELWHLKSDQEKEAWEDYAKRADRFSGYSAFVSSYLGALAP